MLALHQLFLSIWVTVNFGSFIWAAMKHFALPGKPTVSLLLLSLLTVISKGIILSACVFTAFKADKYYFIGFTSVVLSSVLFWWTIRTHSQKKLNGAFSKTPPQHLVNTGPYQYIRHPFYTAYLLTYFGGALASHSAWAWAGFVIPFCTYLITSKSEEMEFQKSTLKEAYAAYKARTGRFLPKIG